MEKIVKLNNSRVAVITYWADPPPEDEWDENSNEDGKILCGQKVVDVKIYEEEYKPAALTFSKHEFMKVAGVVDEIESKMTFEAVGDLV